MRDSIWSGGKKCFVNEGRCEIRKGDRCIYRVKMLPEGNSMTSNILSEIES